MLPPDFTSLSEYEHKEFYKHVAKVCDPDTEKLEGLYNKFLGARCFIIGNGPSLNRHDLSLLEGEYVFAVNSFFYKTDETGFRPTFFVVEDDAVIKENVEQIKAFQAPYKFFPTIYKDLHGEGDNVYFFSANRGYYEKSSPNYCIPRFSTDASKVLYCGQSVTYINMQLAFFLGFTEVYLIGMDFDYVIPKDHGRRGDLIFSTTDDPNHFHKDYFGKGKTWKDPKLDRVGMSYRQAKLSYEAVGRRIYNATIGGKLEIFPRVDYEALLRDPQTKSKRNAAVAPASITAGEGEGQTIAPPAAIVPVVMENTMPTTGAMPVEGGERSLPVQAERTRAEIRAARRAKLRRDPHLFFKDSHFFALRPLRYLFKPTGIGKWQAEMETKSDHDTDGFFSFLPVSRKALAISRTASNSERNRSEAALRSEIAQLRKLAAAREKQEHDSKRVLQDEFNKQFSALDLRLKALPEELEAKDLARAQNIEIALREELAVLGQQITAGLEKSTESESVLRAEILAMQQGIDQRLHAEIDERSQRHLNELRQEVVELTTKLDTQGAAVTSYNTTFAAELEEIKTANQNAGEKIRESIEALKGSGARQTKAANFLLQRVMTSEQQISAMRYPDAPQTLVFFGHHKCASRLFRGEVFKVVAEATGAHIHQYEIKSPPFHYSRGDELDLCNMDFDLIGRDGRDVVLFSNASERTLKRLNRATKDWRGIRIIRDPRQVFISNYFHHKGDHRTEHNGWVYDQLKHDQPLLRELPEEEGLLHELDHISKDVIETQILAPFQDERVLTIKLEDFGMNEKAWLKQISEFLGVADIAGVDLSRTFANPDSSPWQQHFTSRLRSVFKERYGQALIDLGYADDLNW
ncbi:MAG: DUF115 domain-containing protein [Sphingomonas sp.]|nr:DUF115 domain-containing protein [Sphingomonas sp.]